MSAPGDSSFSGAVFLSPAARIAFNDLVITTPYIDLSEMSIVGPPPPRGGVFFCKKTALGSTLRSGTEGYMTHYAYSLISGRLVCRPLSAAADR